MQEEKFTCPVDCPNRKTTLGKGYAYLFSMVITALLGWQSVSIHYSSTKGLEAETKDVPTHILAGYLFLVCGALGFNTDSIAIIVGNILSSGKRIE